MCLPRRQHYILQWLFLMWTVFELIEISSACEPGAIQLARWVTRDLHFDSIPQSPVLTPRSTATDNNTSVFYNGTIITMANGSFSVVDALVVQGDTIRYTGTLDGARNAAGQEAQSIDLAGRTVTPGFVEPHLHLILSALADNYFLKMSPLVVTTLDQAKAVIRDAINSGRVLEGGWIAGFGYDPSRVVDHPELTVDVLDGISRNVSIFILNQSGHAAYLNTAAFNAAGVTAASVAGNRNYQQVNGTLTGVVFEQAVAALGAKVPLPKAADIVKYCVLTLNKWMSKGCTTIFDAGIGSVGVTDIPLMAAVPATPLRFHGALSNLVLQSLSPVIRQPPFKLGSVNITSVKFWADGSTQGFTAAVNESYLDPPPDADPHGIKNYANASVLQAAMDPWLKSGFQLVVHANGDAASDMVLDAYEAVFKANPNRSTSVLHRIEHFTVTRPAQLLRAKALGLGVSHTIGHVYYWGRTFIDYVLGWPRASIVDPLKSDTDAGLVWSLHSDSPVTDVEPLLYLKTATTRLMYLNGTQTLGNTEQVDLFTALKAITVNPAVQMGVDGIIGTLEVGKKADMVVLDRDLRSVPLDELDQIVVEQTWIGGSKVYEKMT